MLNLRYSAFVIGLYRPLQSRVRQNTHLVVLCTSSQCKLRFPFRNAPGFTRNEGNLHCDVLHITTDRVAVHVVDDAIAATQASRLGPMKHVSSNKMAFLLALHNRYHIHRATAVSICWVIVSPLCFEFSP